MVNIDDKFLAELGLEGLGAEDKKDLIKQIRQTLEMRVGMKIAAKLSNEQLKEFEGYINSKDEAGAMQWLGKNYPNYKDTVGSELDKLKAELKKDAPTIEKELGESSKE